MHTFACIYCPYYLIHTCIRNLPGPDQIRGAGTPCTKCIRTCLVLAEKGCLFTMHACRFPSGSIRNGWICLPRHTELSENNRWNGARPIRTLLRIVYNHQNKLVSTRICTRITFCSQSGSIIATKYDPAGSIIATKMIRILRDTPAAMGCRHSESTIDCMRFCSSFG